METFFHSLLLPKKSLRLLHLEVFKACFFQNPCRVSITQRIDANRFDFTTLMKSFDMNKHKIKCLLNRHRSYDTEVDRSLIGVDSLRTV